MAKKKSVASASKSKPKRTAAVMDQTVVSLYISLLEANLGDDTAFMRVYQKLEADPAVRQVDAVAIGCKIVAPMAASTAKNRVLERILKRHKNMVSFKLKQKAVGGRSAA